jgi:hypothetical protein
MQDKLKVLIFSKDRPLQLYCLIESLYKHCNNIEYCDISVLYKTSEVYEELYENITLEFKNIKFIKEKYFDLDLKKILIFNNLEYTMFLVDDIIFKEDFNINYIIDHLNENKESLAFSLRLGLNTNYCYALDTNNDIPKYYEYYNDIIKWKVNDSVNDFAYLFSVDGNVFKSDFIKKIVLSNNFPEFKSPNKFESILSLISIENSEMSSFKTSKLINVPANRVQNDFKNRNENIDVDYFNQKFKNGYKIDISKISLINNNSCHFPINFEFIKR